MADEIGAPSGANIGPDHHRLPLAPDPLAFALVALKDAFRASDRHIAAQLDLKPQEYLAMVHILEGRGELGTVELSTRIGLAVPTTTELIDRLQRFGHVERRRDLSDGRRVQVAPTQSAIAAIIGAIGPSMGDVDRITKSYTPGERELIARFLTEVTDSLRADGGSNPQLPEHGIKS
ncbi:MarR family winged helix-turn-helix transcriptional regulator [Lacisediminihabitans sp. FW035]